MHLNSSLASKVFVIGAYEVPSCELYPFHANPILAEETQTGLLRKSYTINKRQYALKITGNIGKPYNSVDDMFPHPTFLIFTSPPIFQPTAQLIITGKNSYIYETSKFKAVARVIRCIVKKKSSFLNILSCCICIIT